MELRNSASPQHVQRPARIYSYEEGDAVLETERTSLLTDPDVQLVLKKSYSLDDLTNVSVLSIRSCFSVSVLLLN